MSFWRALTPLGRKVFLAVEIVLLLFAVLVLMFSAGVFR